VVSTQILANYCTYTRRSTQFFANYVHFSCSTLVIYTFILPNIDSMFEGVGRRFKQGNLNSSKKNVLNAHSLFPLIFKWESKNWKWEGLWKMPPWHFFFKWLDNDCYVQGLRKLCDGQETCKQDLEKGENKIRAWRRKSGMKMGQLSKPNFDQSCSFWKLIAQFQLTKLQLAIL